MIPVTCEHMSERANERAQWSARAKQAVRIKQVSERQERVVHYSCPDFYSAVAEFELPRGSTSVGNPVKSLYDTNRESAT